MGTGTDMSDLLTITGAGIAGAGVLALFEAPVIGMGPASDPTSHVSLSTLMSYGPVGGAGIGGLFALNPTLYLFVLMIVAGAVLMIVSLMGWV